MEKFQKEYIGLIHAAFADSSFVPSSDFDWKRAVKTAKQHNIAAVLFYGAVNCNVPQKSEHMQELQQLTLQSLMISMRQMREVEQLEEVFQNENIDYMPLKGAVLKTKYPKPEMRTMGDADILIKLEQYAEIEKIMLQRGFEFQYESDHELVWRKPTLFLELHKSIMTTYNKDFYRYFGNGWGIAHRISDSNKHEMSTEDFYIYMFIHFTKHYRISGIGIKHLLDLWVYAKKESNLDWEYIENELQKMKMLQFHKNIMCTIGVWFHGGTEDEITDLITNVLFNSGQYGSQETALINRALQNGKKSAMGIKLERMVRNIFPPYQVLKEKYAVLQKVPVLLPVMWVAHCFDILFLRHKYFVQYIKKMKRIDAKQLRTNKRALHVVGLDFDYEEAV